MSEPNKTVDQQVDALSEPGNEAALNDALNNEFNDQTAGDTPADANPGQNNGVNPSNEPAPNPQNPAGVPNEPAQPAPTDDGNGAAPSNQDGNAGQDNQPVQPNDRFKDILSDRNDAKNVAADAQTKMQGLEQQIKTLTELVVKNGKGGEPANGEPTDETPLTADKVAEIVSKTITDKQSKSDELANAEKSDTEAVNAIITGFISLDIPGIPESLNEKIEEAINSYGDSMF